jgi:hypothetical protein
MPYLSSGGGNRFCSTLLVMMALLTSSGCKEDATPQAKDGEKWLIDFYKRYSIRGGWAFFGAEAKDDNVVVIFNIPDQQGTDLDAIPREQKIKLITTRTCPPIGEGIWSILDATGDVVIDARSNGRLIATVACRKPY